MGMLRVKMILCVSLLSYGGMVSAGPVTAVDGTKQKQNAGINNQPSPDSEKNAAQTQIEQAADHFDAFALQIPTVINAKLDAFMKHGFRAILLDDPETKPAEEKMIGSLVKGLQALGNSLSEDLSRSDTKTEEEIPVKKQPKSQVPGSGHVAHRP